MENRTVILLSLAVVFVAALWWTSRAPGKLVAEADEQAKVIAVELRQRGPDKQARPPVLVTVELGDGGRGKLWLPQPGPAVGQTIDIRVRRFDDGTRRIGAR